MVTRRAVVQALAACATAPLARAAESQIALTAADVHPRDYPTVAAVGWINEQLAAEFGGELSFRVYHSGQLGSEKDTREVLNIGRRDLGKNGSGKAAGEEQPRRNQPGVPRAQASDEGAKKALPPRRPGGIQ